MNPKYFRAELAPAVTRRERVALVQLMEEASELVAICSKTLRWGFDSRHPDGGESNGEGIAKEMSDVEWAFNRLNREYNHTEKRRKRSRRQPRDISERERRYFETRMADGPPAASRDEGEKP